jgi:hypothetical protein
LLFTFFSIGLVFSRGLCCGDDAYHSVVAKNLANGNGYSSSIQEGKSQYKLTEFDTRIGVGPTIILPAAFMIKIFGNQYWVPGLTVVLFWGLELFSIGFLLNKFVKGKFDLVVAIITFFYFCYTLMAYHFEQWFALLGEIPAALLIILSVLVYFQKDSKVNQIFAGLLFSLAIQAKLVTLLLFLTLLLILMLFQFWKKNKLKIKLLDYFSSLSIIGFGFLIPLVILEFWKLISLRFSNYIFNWSKYVNNVTEKGISIDQDLFQKVLQRISILYDRFGIILPIIFLLLVIIGFFIKKDKKIFEIYSVLFSMTIIYTFYWSFLSIGWARYYIIALILIIFIFILPIISTKVSKQKKYLYFISLLIVSIINLEKINIMFPIQNVNLYKPTISTLALEEISHLASTQLKKKPFITQWWATAADVEYLLSTNLNFTTYLDPDLDLDKTNTIIINSKFLRTSDEAFMIFLEQCDTKTNDQYIYGVCTNDPEP